MAAAWRCLTRELVARGDFPSSSAECGVELGCASGCIEGVGPGRWSRQVVEERPVEERRVEERW